ncbi:DUF2993 domain-containing protein [Waterburya agarophytonicola K14]|uniref:DUF2993 domain-containing protein n=1 Tax=Waterburya agarophytonicola KI4 TaxID=2874699 RepID=A0A964FG39_9CYAN|nr:DUF2993 domain-containing protein [Waterburya agarophytonicola]MCC0176083.1 DUF2993 domain-containing protein [Waterburya agarophytonicola KI4]
MITKLLSTAIKFYLRSQVSHVEDLQVKIGGKNRQILQGYIPEVFLSCQKVVYQGLYLQQVKLHGTDIAFNLPEVLKKKPLRLQEAIIVRVELVLDARDLSASIDSSLLQSGLTDLWKIVLAADKPASKNLGLTNSNLKWNNIAIADRELNFSGVYQDNMGNEHKFNLATGVSLANSHTLCLSPLRISNDSDVGNELIEKLEIDLGNDVKIEELIIQSQQILCWGHITVNNG